MLQISITAMLIWDTEVGLRSIRILTTNSKLSIHFIEIGHRGIYDFDAGLLMRVCYPKLSIV